MKTELKAYEERMKKSVASVAADFAAVRAGRANAAVLDRIMVDYYGSPTPIQQIAAFSSPVRVLTFSSCALAVAFQWICFNASPGT